MDPFSGTGAAGLQSGFVLAVILLAVFLADRLGGSGQFAQRGFQVALGLALTFLVISATAAFARPPALPEELLEEEAAIISEPFEEEALAFFRETARNASEVRTIHAGLGLIFVMGGLALLARLRVLPLGLVVGGLFLLLFGGVQAGGQPSDPFSLIFGALSSILRSCARDRRPGAGDRPLRGAALRHGGAGRLRLLALGARRSDGGGGNRIAGPHAAGHPGPGLPHHRLTDERFALAMPRGLTSTLVNVILAARTLVPNRRSKGGVP